MAIIDEAKKHLDNAKDKTQEAVHKSAKDADIAKQRAEGEMKTQTSKVREKLNE